MEDQLFLILLTLFLGGIFSTVAGGGFSIILLIAGSLYFDIRTNIAVVALLTLTMQISKVAHFYQYAHRSLVLQYSLTGIPFSLLGGLTLYYVPTRVPEVLLGGICLLFVVLKIFKKAPHFPIHRASTLFFGAFTGFVGSLAGNIAPLRNSVLLSMGLTKEVLTGTSATIALLMSIGKLAAYIPNTEWSPFLFSTLLAGIPVVLVSVWIGKNILTKISTRTFEFLLLSVITIGAIRFLLP